MINAIDLVKLRNAEYLQFMKDFVNIVERNDPNALNVTAKLADLQTKVGEMDTLFKKMLANENTTTLLNIDKRRDDCINGLFYVVQGYEYHFEETLRVAAQKLATNLRFYGSGISRLNYQAETATLTNIINDWETKPELIAALTTLNLTAWKDEMKKQNNAFNTVYLDRTQEYGNATPENLISKRNEANTVYYALRDRITAFHTLIEAPAISPYATSINQLNALIDQYNNLIVGRAKSVDLTTSTQN
ncbi:MULTISPECIES: DUF6261 family protein [Flavobacterium]|uniref:Uncharacterized protein n=1 Tax=Flavobacterium columnare TaxID=996 RepID=A0AA94EZ87_9FLAO|nr:MULTISPECIES: DUF6261 family protein [Flavobacterium]MCH4830930.1 hypothetical protein [Flavobacterium columnare]MCH4833129.1 hypothetical protein [Flavobacterium columnare]QYS90862.1 hypothetical protein JJC04_13175 [Flavobacterium covae]